MNEKKLEELLANVATADEALKVLNDNGISITAEELNAAIAEAEGQGEEMSETELENVAGGSRLSNWVVHVIIGAVERCLKRDLNGNRIIGW